MWSKKAAAAAGGAIFLTLAGLIRLNYLFISAGLVMLTFVVISSFLDGWMPTVKIRMEPSSDNIFKDSKYGVIGDWNIVLPAFTAAVRELVNEN